jgi:hypothetical protein
LLLAAVPALLGGDEQQFHSEANPFAAGGVIAASPCYTTLLGV